MLKGTMVTPISGFVLLEQFLGLVRAVERLAVRILARDRRDRGRQ